MTPSVMRRRTMAAVVVPAIMPTRLDWPAFGVAVESDVGSADVVVITDPSAPVVTIVVKEVLETVDVDSTNSVVELGKGGGGVLEGSGVLEGNDGVDEGVGSSLLDDGVIGGVEGSAEDGGGG